MRRHYDYIYAVCRRITGNDADAQDGTQEALIAIAKGLSKFNRQSTFTSWAYRVATNACLDEMRRKNRRPIPVDSDNSHQISSDPAVDKVVSQQLYVDEALAQLDEIFRLPIILREMAGLEYWEISECLDIPIGTVRSRISRGRQHLLQIFIASGELGDPDRTS